MKHEKECELYWKLYDHDPLKAHIFLMFIRNHRGIENAITIDGFMEEYKLKGEIPRRSFRKFYSEEISVAYVNTEEKKGLYWPTERKDMKPIRDLRKKAMAMLVRVKRIEDQHCDLIESEQLEISL